MSGWWRRNRWGVVALPFVVTAAMAASGSRLGDLWWDVELRHAAGASPGETVRLRTTYVDATGTQPREVDLRLVGVEAVTEVLSGDFVDENTTYAAPAGTTIFAVEIAWAASPDVPLVGCNVEIVTTAGEVLGTTALRDVVTAPDPCVPADATGPLPDIGVDLGADPDEPERPATWTTTALVLADAGATPASVRVWWEPPDYASLEVALG